jgi:hypothetical protein
MKKSLVLTALLVAAVGVSFRTVAADTQPAAAPAAEKKSDSKKQKKTPFKGEVKAANQQAKTFTIGERTFHLTSETRIEKAGVPATFQEVKAGEKVTGSSVTSPEGRLEAVSIYVGGKGAEGGKAKEGKKDKGDKAAPKKGEPAAPEPAKDQPAPVAPAK